ncbi:hypothetical protein M9H77_36014 [Catharanthus roseus]|uniref:Uncharacterized protein n=1 Tax=Catharanthus roseus TaxID=4058 RepID=A0ACB9ZSD4_CATRO|nr:hypothetical protein M9H77_36014 [Catharanthus roseus]
MNLNMSMEAQLPAHYNEGNSGSLNSNLEPMKDMMEMQGNMTNLSMEHRDQRNIGGHDNRLGARNYYNDNRSNERTWSLMKQALRIRCGVESHEGETQGQKNVKFMESLMGEKSTKVDEHGKELSIGYEDTSIRLSLNPFLLRHEFSFKELKLFLELYVSYVILGGNLMINPFTCELALDVDHMRKCSSPCAYLEK